MPAHLREFLTSLGETFWLLPAALTRLGVFGAIASRTSTGSASRLREGG